MRSVTIKQRLTMTDFSAADCTIKVWNAQTGSLVHTLEGHLAGVSTISWAPDSTILASGSDDKSIRLWDVRTVCSHDFVMEIYTRG
jgi:COMPASS component SWD3